MVGVARVMHVGHLIYLNGKAHWTLTSDDAAISFAYAQNIAQGYGSHSPGAEPVEGFSQSNMGVFAESVFMVWGRKSGRFEQSCS